MVSVPAFLRSSARTALATSLSSRTPWVSKPGAGIAGVGLTHPSEWTQRRHRMCPPHRRETAWRVGLLVVVLLAVGLRARHVRDLSVAWPWFDVVWSDAAGYLGLARRVADGDPWAGHAPFVQGPGYPYALAALVWLRPRVPGALQAGSEVAFIRWVQSLAGGLTCLLAALLARRLAGRRVGLATGLLTALHGPLIAFDAALSPAVLLVPLLLALLLATLATDRLARRVEGRAPLVCWAGVGLLLGVAALVRMNLLLCALPWTWLAAAGRWRRDRLAALASALCLAAGVALPLGWLVARGHAAHGRPGWVHGGGLNLYLAHNPDWRRTVEVRPGPQWRAIYRLPAARLEADPAAWDRDYRRRVGAWWKAAPRDAIAGQLVRTGRWLSGHERRRNIDLYQQRGASRVLRWLVGHPPRGPAWPFAVLGPLAVVGLWVRRRRWREDLPVLLFIAGYGASLLPFFATARYRLPLAVVLIIPAAVALDAAIRSPRRAWRGALLVALLAALASVHRQGDDPRYRAELALAAGDAAVDRGQAGVGLRRFEEALRLWPESADALVRLALALEGSGDAPGALRALGRAVAAEPESWTLRRHRAQLLEAHGAYADAEAEVRVALRLRPDLGRLHRQLARCRLRAGDRAGARAAALRAWRLDPDDVRARDLVLALR